MLNNILLINKFMYENISLSGLPEEMEDFPIVDYFSLSELQGEFVILIEPDSTFYFLCSDYDELTRICDANDWYIVSHSRFNEQLIIGIGLAGKEYAEGSAFRVPDKKTYDFWCDILRFTFKSDFTRLFLPYNNFFDYQEIFDGSPCLYIHDYYPVSYRGSITVHQKKVSNLIFRFKEGKNIPLIAKIFSLAIGRMSFFDKGNDAVLIPIPASTKEKNRSRFSLLCELISKKTGFANGYNAIEILTDREPMKGLKGQDKLSNLSFNAQYFIGKDVFLTDDIITTGEGFIQIKNKLMELGAKSVTGLFLGRTVEPKRD